MDPDSGEMKELRNVLCEIGCCKYCTLRFLGVVEAIDYKSPIPTDIIAKVKDDTCIVCLGLFKDVAVYDAVEKVCDKAENENYQCTSFNITVTLPIPIMLRAHSMTIFIRNRFPHLYKRLFPLGMVTVNVKDVWKWTVGSTISKNLNISLWQDSEFIINVMFDYKDESEYSCLTNMGYKTSKRPRGKGQYELFSRKSVDNFLTTISENQFLEFYGVPPKLPKNLIYCSSVSLQNASIYIGGRYFKFSRALSQTPWIIDGERRKENSIEEVISGPLLEAVKCDDINFVASGREDVDVRTLGNGRPFYIDFVNPRVTSLSSFVLNDIQKKINTVGLGLVAVNHLQMVKKEHLKLIKEGEEHKKKQYCAYCIVFGHLPVKLDQLAKMAPLTIDQKTPLRVLHRRPLAVRPKTIFYMRAVPHINALDPKGKSYFKLFIETQAGTYIKEFVHGDFGRTKPSLGDLLGDTRIDIDALDVQNVILDWPPPSDQSDVR